MLCVSALQVNHDTQTTQWEKPVVVDTPQIHDALSDLPAGWEVSVVTIDTVHITKQTTCMNHANTYTVVYDTTCVVL